MSISSKLLARDVHAVVIGCLESVPLGGALDLDRRGGSQDTSGLTFSRLSNILPVCL
jgi:hypothetical protein